MPTLTHSKINTLHAAGKINDYQASVLHAVAPPEVHKFTFDDLRIRTKDKQIVAFAPNDVQIRYLNRICPNWREGDYGMGGLQEIILKARQFGFSTLIGALFFLDTINNPGTGTVVISNDKVNSKKLFEMIDRMYRNLPEDRRPQTQRANTDELYWPDIDCHYQVMTAGTKTSGRGWTVNNLHCSEVGFWEYPEVLGGLLDAVPAGGNVFLESTANGEGSEERNEDGEDMIQGNAFHVNYVKAKEGRSPYTANFFAWFEHKEYRLRPPYDFVRTNAETEKEDPIMFARYANEERLAELYSLDDEQLFWRRQMIERPGKGPALFCQEYPANDVEAFRTSGKKFFAGVWDEGVHVKEMEIQPWWTPIGGADWGYGVPYCFLLGWVFPLDDGTPGVYVSDEAYGARVRNPDQAQKVIDILTSHALSVEDVTVFADPAMWGKTGAHQADRVGRADVEDFQDRGLNYVKANNNRAHGCTNMRNYLTTKGAIYVSPRCRNLIRTMPLVLHDPHDLEVYETSQDCEQHAIDTFRYLLNSRPRANEVPAAQPKTYYNGLPIVPIKQLPPELQSGDEEYAGNYDYEGVW